MNLGERTEKQAVSSTLAAIDIGSNSIRMAIGQILPDGRVETLEQVQRAVHLGQDTFRRGRLGRMVMRSAVAILKEYLRMLKLYDVRHIWAVATSAVREAVNSEIFLDRVLMTTGMEINLITPPEESRLTVSAVRLSLGNRTKLFKGKTLIAEVGGGSTILTVLNNGKIAGSQSLYLGAVRLQEVFTTGGETNEQAAQIIKTEVESVLDAVQSIIPFDKIDNFIAIGGDVRCAAKLISAAEDEKEPFNIIKKEDLAALIEKLTAKKPEQLVRQYHLSIADAETINTALIVYEAMLRRTKTEVLAVSKVSMRDGLIIELAQRIAGKEDKTAAQGVIDSATALARKYKVNLKHARHLQMISAKLFDLLSSEHGLSARYRLLLEAAAILHEVGIFISGRSYHKHTFYLIVNSEIFGLTQSEVQMVAHIARYHRRSRPKASHIEYMSLTREKRIIVNKLAAIIRLAGALKVSAEQELEGLKFAIKKDNLLITIPGRRDLLLRRSSLERQSDMFTDVYGLSPLL